MPPLDNPLPADESLSPITGEFNNHDRERCYLRVHWPEQSRQLRVVLTISVIAYLLAFYQNYLDLKTGSALWAVGGARLALFAAFGWAIAESRAAFPSRRLQTAVFAAELLTGISETVEMLAYHQAGFVINLISAPFFSFVILIFYIFIPIRWSLTTWASLLGSGYLVAGYAYIAQGELESIIRHPVVLLGVIAIGAGAVRGMNRAGRQEWLQGKRLEGEIAERRRAEERALEASRVKGEFLAVMSHEIRTPLNSILAMTEILTEDAPTDDARRRRRLEILATASRHLDELIGDILDFSRLEAGAEVTTDAPFDLRETVADAAATVHTLAATKGLELTVALGEHLPPRVVGDGKRLRQILINLIGNAVKFTDTGRIEVSVRAAVPPSGGIHFAVSDTGEGIPGGTLERIFEPFQQADASPARVYSGTGLGLAISRNLVERMGGRIHADNRPEGGAVFDFILPLAATDEAVPVGESAPMMAPATPFKALVVEDSPLNCRVIEEYLSDVPCRLRFAASGLEGVAALRAEPFDVVLMDLRMPDMDGIEATRAIRRWEKKHRHTPTPIVIVTADGLSENRQRAQRAGADGYLSKPISRAKLFETLHRYLHGVAPPVFGDDRTDPSLQPLLPRYFAQMEHDLQAMARAADRGEFPALTALAHTAKGHSQLFGFDDIAEAANALEEISALTTPESAATVHAAIETLRKACRMREAS
ncbi:ATP-binding protein [Endothiovibrio diazotrophicus]